MKTLVRVALVLGGATGICIALSLVASADVGNPTDAYRSAFKIALAGQPVDKALEPAPVAKPAAHPLPTPAPEEPVIQAPARAVPVPHGDSVAARVAKNAQAKYQEIESFLGRVAGARHDGVGSGTGVPVLVLALVGAVAVLDRHRLRAALWATDESALELLYARELTPPG